jgi:hypothetical protein
MHIQIHQAVELYNQACLAEQEGKPNLAEVYYLKSWAMFEEAGGSHYVNAANALNALAYLRQSRGNHEGALCSAKKSVQILEAHKTESRNGDAELVRMQAWDLINQLVCGEVC